MIAVLVALLGCSAASAIPAQSPLTPGPAKIEGRIVDSLTGAPIRRAEVCHAPAGTGSTPPRELACVYADSLGHFLLPRIPVGTRYLQYNCVAAQRASDYDVRLGTARIAAKTTGAPITLRGEGRWCDQRPFVVQRGVFSGRFHTGPDQSWFITCGDLTRGVWVHFNISRDPALFPLQADTTLFVRWSGALVGPGVFGRNAAARELRVDSVIEARAVRAGDCR